MKKTVRKLAVLGGLALSIAGLALTPTAVANPGGGDHARPAKPRTIEVRGELIPIPDSVNYTVTGTLSGTWYYNAQEDELFASKTFYAEAGTERIEGCIDRKRDGCDSRDPDGGLNTVFLYWASFKANGDLIRGDCVHPVTGGDGVFTGARGRIDVVDRLVNGQVRSTYRGEIVLNAVVEDPAGPTQSLRTEAGAGAGANLHKGC